MPELEPRLVAFGWHSEGIATLSLERNMDTNDFDTLQGRDDAIHRTLGLLVRQLHIKRIIEAPDLIREIRLVVQQIDPAPPAMQACRTGMEEIAQAFEGSLPGWTEERLIHDLYLAGPGTDR